MAKKYKAKFLDYFEKENRSALSVSQALNESYFINFSFITISTLTFFVIVNAAVGFLESCCHKSYLALIWGNIECFSEEGIGTTFQFTLKKA